MFDGQLRHVRGLFKRLSEVESGFYPKYGESDGCTWSTGIDCILPFDSELPTTDERGWGKSPSPLNAPATKSTSAEISTNTRPTRMDENASVCACLCVCVCVCVCVRKYNKSRTGSGNTEATTGRNRAESKGGRNNGPATPVGPATRAAPSLIPLSLSLTLFHKAPPFDQRHPLCHRHHRRRPIQCPTSRAALWPPS